MKTFVVSMLLLAVALAVSAQQRPGPAMPANAAAPADAATLTIQFDNSKRAVLNAKKEQEVLQALATHVFMVPVSQVKILSSLDQSSRFHITNSQSVVVFEATGPTTNRKSVLANCEENTRGRWVGLRESAAKKAVKKATDSWWPGDKVKIQKASCTPGAAPATAGPATGPTAGPATGPTAGRTAGRR